ncbi:hypothetical protein G6O67_002809 [Ophiocordyceps sinensis]|uniref:Reticulon domain-containing protein n=2 Tax=Ophiocordyceps sinensis TaxID=72228 RepID=A0A8H4V7Z0_9HYPO|nr:hypothetical protein G6O67_002809 [Ophiocordyceps sinensis]
MSGPTHVVMPIQGDAAEQDASSIASAIRQSLHGETHSGQQPNGPLKKILAHQDSLYKYISWEDPVRTIGSYMGAISIILGAHFLPLTQLALKAGATILGAISITELASRSFGPNTLLARLRPSEYKKFPESTLNATLKDIHDLIQYAVVQAQRIVLGQDLGKTFVAFLGCTALYWLINAVPVFMLAVLALTSVYIAPILFSVEGREVGRDAMIRAKDVTSTVVENGKTLAQDGAAKTADLSSTARKAGIDPGRRSEDTAQDGKQTAADMCTQARDTASSTPGEVSEKLPDKGTNVMNEFSE